VHRGCGEAPRIPKPAAGPKDRTRPKTESMSVIAMLHQLTLPPAHLSAQTYGITWNGTLLFRTLPVVTVT
jgi:hypothetical protein